MNQVTSPSLVQVRAFVAVADHLHFGEAAGVLGVSVMATT